MVTRRSFVAGVDFGRGEDCGAICIFDADTHTMVFSQTFDARLTQDDLEGWIATHVDKLRRYPIQFVCETPD